MAARLAASTQKGTSAREAMTPPTSPKAGDLLLAMALADAAASKALPTGNPWLTECWSATDQMALVKADPAKAARLQSEAGATQPKPMARHAERPSGIAPIRARNPVHAAFIKNRKV